MRKLYFCCLVFLIIGIVGCSDDLSSYCCAGNSECLETSEGLHSCSMESCGHCILVAPLKFTIKEWKYPMVGQDNYKVELTAEGGKAPYTWELSVTDVAEKKLNWLTLTPDESDSKKATAYLTNLVEDDTIEVPKLAAIIDEGLRVKITLKDYTKRDDKDMDRVDNTGYTIEHQMMIKESACENGDGFCPKNCTIGDDSDCLARCGDGIVSLGETCDIGINTGNGGSCNTQETCDDDNRCTIDTVDHPDTCQAACAYEAITRCKNGDDCCAPGCNSNNDDRCSPFCGNAILEEKEDCDPGISADIPGACPTSCNDGNPCTKDNLSGEAGQCTAKCTHLNITQCITGDGCCLSGCHHKNDQDCECSCGDNYVDDSCDETCDGNCPTSCDDGNKCTTDTLSGSSSTCDVRCSHVAITPCCGNGVVENGETCDGNCPTTCPDDGNACTTESLTGIASSCNVQCTHPAIIPCCRNGTVESGETCDGNCPTSCDDSNPCTDDSMTGNANNCNVACGHSNKIDGFDCGSNRRCVTGVCTTCSGCWVGSLCLPGTTLDRCGTGGIACNACEDDASSHCLPTGCTDGQCTYRYIIQMNSGIEEVLDNTTGVLWKRVIESGTFIQVGALVACAQHSYELPTFAQLFGILESGHGSPTINLCAFPNTTGGRFWTSSNASGQDFWFVDFSNASQGFANMMDNKYSVRCKR